MKLTDKEVERMKLYILKQEEEKEKEQKAISFNKKIVTLVLTLNITFTIAVLVLYYIGWNEPTTLIQAWFKFTGTELVALAGIKGLDTIKEMVEVWKGANNE